MKLVKLNKKPLSAAIGLVSILLICVIVAVNAIEIETIPPEWIGSSNANTLVGTYSSGTYQDTWTKNQVCYVVEACAGSYNAEVRFTFGDVKCSLMKAYCFTDPYFVGGTPYSAWVYYVGDTGYTYLGVFNNGVESQFNLNTAKYVRYIKISFYRYDFGSPRLVKYDWITCYTTGQP